MSSLRRKERVLPILPQIESRLVECVRDRKRYNVAFLDGIGTYLREGDCGQNLGVALRLCWANGAEMSIKPSDVRLGARECSEEIVWRALNAEL